MISNITLEIVKEKRKLKKTTNVNRKERAHKLIVLGTLFKLLEIDNEDHNLLLGLLMKYYYLTEKDKEELKERGKIFKIEREKYLEEERMKNEE
ncbi:conjugal transfer protein TraD [Streptobacillus moniliformis]|uniref:conjugal transfer protein TraD n=1 Tax=Streptobacillus moniliformis TaxID=34105 RepID=UPI0007E3C114|nr:conjugal transfer protein TraD [Streptobacillus moniliformis]